MTWQSVFSRNLIMPRGKGTYGKKVGRPSKKPAPKKPASKKPAPKFGLRSKPLLRPIAPKKPAPKKPAPKKAAGLAGGVGGRVLRTMPKAKLKNFKPREFEKLKPPAPKKAAPTKLKPPMFSLKTKPPSLPRPIAPKNQGGIGRGIAKNAPKAKRPSKPPIVPEKARKKPLRRRNLPYG